MHRPRHKTKQTKIIITFFSLDSPSRGSPSSKKKKNIPLSSLSDGFPAIQLSHHEGHYCKTVKPETDTPKFKVEELHAYDDSVSGETNCPLYMYIYIFLFSQALLKIKPSFLSLLSDILSFIHVHFHFISLASANPFLQLI